MRNCFAGWNNYENKPLKSAENHMRSVHHIPVAAYGIFNEISNVSVSSSDGGFLKGANPPELQT